MTTNKSPKNWWIVVNILVFLVNAALIGGYSLRYDVEKKPGKPDWPPEISRVITAISQVAVIDNAHHKTLFRYDQDSGVGIVSFKRSGENTWQVEFEASSVP